VIWRRRNRITLGGRSVLPAPASTIVLVTEPSRRRRTRTILSLVLLLIVSAKRSEQHASNGRDEGGSSNVVSTLTVIPELIDEVAQFIRAMRTG
jgi:hypothetical protein